jgi:hypothetical protein
MQYRCTLEDDGAFCAQLSKDDEQAAHVHIEHWFDLLYRDSGERRAS